MIWRGAWGGGEGRGGARSSPLSSILYPSSRVIQNGGLHFVECLVGNLCSSRASITHIKVRIGWYCDISGTGTKKRRSREPAHDPGPVESSRGNLGTYGVHILVIYLRFVTGRELRRHFTTHGGSLRGFLSYEGSRGS